MEPLPVYVHSSFDSARARDGLGTDAYSYHGPYNTLLHTVTVDRPLAALPFLIAFTQKTTPMADYHLSSKAPHPTPTTIHPNPLPSDFLTEEKRHAADQKMRLCFAKLLPNLDSPKLLGICAFGENGLFYEYSRETGEVICISEAPVNILSPAAWLMVQLELNSKVDQLEVN